MGQFRIMADKFLAESVLKDIGGKPGDTRLMWSPTNTDEVENARKTFDNLVNKKKFSAFKVGVAGEMGNQITEFDPQAEKIILVPQIRGG